MMLPYVPHAAKVWTETDPPRTVLHVQTHLQQLPAHIHAEERHDFLRAVARALGFRTQFDDAIIHWADGTT